MASHRELREHLGLETQRPWSRLVLLRSTPALCGLFSVGLRDTYGMQTDITLTRIIYKDTDIDWYVALCPEVDVASQSKTIEEARAALTEAVTLFFESASAEEISRHMPNDIYIAPIHTRMTVVESTHA